MFFESLVAKDNPNLNKNQIYEAANAIANGQETLSDGTPVKISPASQSSLDRITKGTTTAPLITQSIKANQAHAELQTLTEMSNKDFAPYAETYAGYSPQQIVDSFKKDKTSQERLGNFIASQAAQYEAAQIRNRIAGGEPGISATQELMGKSGQIVKTLYPRLSAEARAQATKRLDQYLDKALEARNKIGLRPSDIKKSHENKNNQEESNNDPLGIR